MRPSLAPPLRSAPLRLLAPFALCAVLPMAACGGGGGGGGQPGPVGVAGSWNLTIQPDGSALCTGRVQTPLTFRIEVSQSGQQVTIADVSGLQFSGTVVGNGMELSGRYPISGSFASVPDLQLAFAADGSLTGSGAWSQSVGGTACTGTDGFRAVRIPPLEDLAGTWNLNETVIDSSCTLTTPRFSDVWTVTQVGNRVTVTRQGTGSQASGQVTSSGRLALEFDYVDPSAGRTLETFVIDFLVDRAPPGLTAISEWSLPGCRGRSEHAGLRTAR